jgi:hypothetical protein
MVSEILCSIFAAVTTMVSIGATVAESVLDCANADGDKSRMSALPVNACCGRGFMEAPSDRPASPLTGIACKLEMRGSESIDTAAPRYFQPVSRIACHGESRPVSGLAR